MVESFTSSAGAPGRIMSKRKGIGATGFKKVKRFFFKKKAPYKKDHRKCSKFHL